MRQLLLPIGLALSIFAIGFTFSGSGSPFSTGESVTATNMNEIDTALDNLEAGTAQTVGGDLSGTLASAVVVDDSHNHVITNIDTFATSALMGRINDESGGSSAYLNAAGGWTTPVGTSLWTDGGTVTYLTVETDDFSVGGQDSSASFHVDVGTGDVSCGVAGCTFTTTRGTSGDQSLLYAGSADSTGGTFLGWEAPDTVTAGDDVVFQIPDGGCTAGEVMEVASVNTAGSPDIVVMECDTDDSSGGIAGTTFSICETLYAPNENIAATDDIPSIWRAPTALTITEVWCETDQTVTLDLQIDDGTPADVMGADLNCGTGTADSTGLTGGMADGDRLDLAIATASGSPTRLTVCWEYDYD